MGSLAEHQPSQRLVPRREPVVPDDEIDIFDQGDGLVPPADPPPPVVHPARKPTIQERFEQYHAAHPEVYAEFVRLARLAKAKGHAHIGMKMLGELVRWHFIVDREYDAEAEQQYALNNVVLSRYARLIMEQEPDLAGIFQTRKITSK